MGKEEQVEEESKIPTQDFFPLARMREAGQRPDNIYYFPVRGNLCHALMDDRERPDLTQPLQQTTRYKSLLNLSY